MRDFLQKFCVVLYLSFEINSPQKKCLSVVNLDTTVPLRPQDYTSNSKNEKCNKCNFGLIQSEQIQGVSVISSKTKGPAAEGGPQKSSQKFRHRKWPISSADFPLTPMERTEHHFGPFWEKEFGAISGGPFFSRPLCFTAECNLWVTDLRDL